MPISWKNVNKQWERVKRVPRVEDSGSSITVITFSVITALRELDKIARGAAGIFDFLFQRAERGCNP